jgi:hypothetical protein
MLSRSRRLKASCPNGADALVAYVPNVVQDVVLGARINEILQERQDSMRKAAQVTAIIGSRKATVLLSSWIRLKCW